METAIERLGATIDELQRPSSPRGRLPEPEHVHREHRLLPSLVTIESYLIDVHHEHNTTGRCGWCGPSGCWAHQIARVLMGAS